MRGMLRSRQRFVVEDGAAGTVTINEGEWVAEDHALVSRYPGAFESREETIAALAREPRNREAGAAFHEPARPQDAAGPGDKLRSEASRANERAGSCPTLPRAHGAGAPRDDAPDDGLARYVLAASNRDYFRAFSKLMNDPVSGAHLWTPEEREAVQRVKTMQRSLTLGTGGTAGGFLVPYELDPQIIIASAGAVSPLRRDRPRRHHGAEREAVRHLTGVTAHWDPEETETTDDTPTLLQPTITSKKGAAFVQVVARAVRGLRHRPAGRRDLRRRQGRPRGGVVHDHRDERANRHHHRARRGRRRDGHRDRDERARPGATCTPTRPRCRRAGARTPSG